MNLTLIDLPGLTKVAVGKWLSVTLLWAIVLWFFFKRFFPPNFLLAFTLCRGSTRQYCSGHWKHGSIIHWKGIVNYNLAAFCMLIFPDYAWFNWIRWSFVQMQSLLQSVFSFTCFCFWPCCRTFELLDSVLCNAAKSYSNCLFWCFSAKLYHSGRFPS